MERLQSVDLKIITYFHSCGGVLFNSFSSFFFAFGSGEEVELEKPIRVSR